MVRSIAAAMENYKLYYRAMEVLLYAQTRSRGDNAIALARENVEIARKNWLLSIPL